MNNLGSLLDWVELAAGWCPNVEGFFMTCPYGIQVIPAQVGIQYEILVSRLRGNDGPSTLEHY